MKFPIAVGILLLFVFSAGAEEGYRVETNRVVVDEDHWQAWNFPAGTVGFDERGSRPQFASSQINAALDAHTFFSAGEEPGGVRKAGSNLGNAANIIDGDPSTYWEPDPNAPLRDWWVEIDLGRTVWARKIVVKFVDGVEVEGDPLLQFRLLTSSGLPAFLQSKTLDFIGAGRSEGLNKTQRVFEFDLQPNWEADPGFAGDQVQYVQIVATASASGQGQAVSAQMWEEELAEDERGDVVYYRRESSGVLRQIDRAQHEAISDESQKGPVEYYRRELPRLAEVEVWTVGDNLSLTALERGGRIEGEHSKGSEPLSIDGNYNSFWNEQVGFGGLEGMELDMDHHLVIDLGSWYWVNRMAIIFDRTAVSGDHGGAFPDYVVSLSDGSLNPDGSLAYTPMTTHTAVGGLKFPKIFFQDNFFPLTRARFLRMDYPVYIVGSWVSAGIRELQVYGHGFLPQVTLESQLIELGVSPRILSTIEWEADTPPGTQIQIRTRTGDELKEDIHYFTNTGQQVTEAKYRKLLSFQKGDSTVSIIPGAGWSNWSKFYPASGSTITSPSPRRYALVQATLLSDDPEQAATLGTMGINLDRPLARQVMGEIAPGRVEELGTKETFTLYLKPTFENNSSGFDQLLVQLPPGTEVELIDVAVGSQSELDAGEGKFDPINLERLPSAPDSLWVRLPEAVKQAQDRVALRFSGILYLASNTFLSSVGRGEDEARVWQRVDAEREGRGMTVFTPFIGGVMGTVEVSSNPFTPNGDGVNDEVLLQFSVYKVQGDKPLLLEVYSLDGELVQRVEQPVLSTTGSQQLSWDGRGRSGQLMPPGLYVCRVGVEVDAAGKEPMVAKLVASVY